MVGQSAELTEDEDEFPVWGNALSGIDGQLRGYNKTNYKRDMSVGTVRGTGSNLIYEPTFAWSGVGYFFTPLFQVRGLIPYI